MATKKQVEKSTEEISQNEKLTTSKKLLIVAWGLLVILLALDIFGIEVETSLEIVGGIVTAIVSSVYLWKARAENKVKITITMVDSLADKYGVENVIEILHDILND